VIRQPRALAALQGHVAAVGPALEAVHHVGQAGAALGEPSLDATAGATFS
jgi:hypothetical protein